MRLNAPDINAHRSIFADWLELQALISDRRLASFSMLRTIIRRANDDRIKAKVVDPDSDVDEPEPEVTERVTDDLEERVFEEIELRKIKVGTAYPFQVRPVADNSMANIVVLEDDWGDLCTGKLFYVFCLLNTAVREGLITLSEAEKSIETEIGKLFQVCSCLAVAGYIGPDVVSFGFPRPQGNAFLPALRAMCDRYGSYSVVDKIPYGWDVDAKDGGIDIIAWRHFPDGHAGTYMLFVQVASGKKWRDKSVGDDVRALKKWFNPGGFEHFLPAICIPFPLWQKQEEPPKNIDGTKISFSDGVKAAFENREGKFGVIFDRGRLSFSAGAAVADKVRLKNRVEGFDQVEKVEKWVEDVRAALATPRAA